MQVILAACICALLVVFGVVQLASDSLSAAAAAPHTLPHLIPPAFGERVYRVLDRIAPAPYVEEALAQRELELGDAQSALQYAVRLPRSSTRDGLMAKIAFARGQPELGNEYLIAAFDIEGVQSEADRIAARDPEAAFELMSQLDAALQEQRTHPDELARARWVTGLYANRTAWRKVPGSSEQRRWLAKAYDNFDAAVELAPLSERYLIAAANQADLLARRDRAAALFAKAAALDPGSADALAGLGVVAFENGDRQAAAEYLARARAIDPQSLMVRALERDLR